MTLVAQPLVVADRLDSFAAATTFLSRVFLRPPDQQLIAAVADVALWEQWPLRRDEWTERGLADMHAAVTSDKPETLEQLAHDYQRLFVGPAHVIACPYESVYLSEEHLIFEEQTLAVRHSYARFGLQAPALHREPDDHVGLELDFLARLCQMGLDALDDGDNESVGAITDAMGAFLTEHLLRWVFECLESLHDGANSRFYRGLSSLTEGAARQLRMAFVS